MSKALLWAIVSPSRGTAELIRFPGGGIKLAKPRRNSRGTKNALNTSSQQSTGRKTGRGNRDDDAALLPARCGVVMNPAGHPAAGTSDPKVLDAVDRHVDLFHKRLKSEQAVNEAYEQCGKMCAEQDSSFYLGTLLTTPEKRRALWAIAVWCRRTDELVDGPNASSITSAAMDRWEARLEDIFEGRPADIPDAALSDTVAKFAIDIQPFKDMIEGMKMDLRKSRYENFEELYLYSYRVAGTVGLMTVPVMGIETDLEETTYDVFNAALALGTAFQLTNILRDVGEDARRGRIYLPQDELAEAGLSDEDVFAGKVTDKWRNFMKEQIARAGFYYDEAEKGIARLSSTSRWPVWASLLLYRKILDEIEANDYNSFTRKANVSKPKRLLALLIAYAKSALSQSRSRSPFSA